MTVQRLRDGVLRTQIDVMMRAAALRDEMTSAVKRLARGERGQTPTEYLMIVGFMAVVIVIWYWNNVKDSAKAWSKNVQNAIKGGTVKQ
jgi:Flp pilus assembly pilin Flp